MSTRAIYTFKDKTSTVHVYKHSDGYPRGAADTLQFAKFFAWNLPRFEADEFAAAFVTAGKMPHFLADELEELLIWIREQPTTEEYGNIRKQLQFELSSYFLGADGYEFSGGGVRVIPQKQDYTNFAADIEYRYEISYSAREKDIFVRAFKTNYWYEPHQEIEIFVGTLSAFAEKYSKKNEQVAPLPL